MSDADIFPVIEVLESREHQTESRSLLFVRRAVKDVIERTLCLVALIVLLIPMSLIALFVKLDSPGPAFFVQPRFGRAARPFGLFKFRTMRVDMGDLSGGRQTALGDPRVTRVGAFLRRTSMDELPQLLNVVLGHMALVGPRAHPCGMKLEGALCADLVAEYHDRHVIKPGITGLAQVSGSRGAVESRAKLQRRVDLDLFYIRNWSLRMDAIIVWRTVVDLFTGRAAG